MPYSISGTVSTVVGATVTAYNYPSGTVAGTATTTTGGAYSITGLATGDYKVVVSPIAGYCFAANGSFAYTEVINANTTGVNFSVYPLVMYHTDGTGNIGTPATSLSLSWTSYNNNPIIVMAPTITTSISDTLGNSYIFAGTDGAFNWYYAVSSKGSSGGSSNTVTVNFPSNTYQLLSIWELGTSGNGSAISTLGTLIPILLAYNTSNISANHIDSNPFSTLVNTAFVFAEGSINGGTAANSWRGGLTADKTQFGGYSNTGHELYTSAQTNTTVGFGFGASSQPLYNSIAVFGWVNNSILGNCGVGGATVSYSGPRSGSVTADASGNYVIPYTQSADLATFTITPTLSGVTFSPSSNTVTVSALNADTAGPSFTGSSTITSGPTYTVTESTIVATWTTAGATNSQAFATGGGVTNKAALDNAQPVSETTHYAVITGLKPSTTYSVYVQSGTTQSSASNVTTSPAQARFYVSGFTLGTFASTTLSGSAVQSDTFFPFLSNDGKEYATFCDAVNWSANQAVFTLNPTTNAVTQVNLLSGFGGTNTYDGADNGFIAGNTTTGSTKKWGSGLASVGGNLFGFTVRQTNNSSTLWYQYRSGIIKSADHGVTWANWQTPSVTNANGYEPTPVWAYLMDQWYWSFCTVVRYAGDDGTLGYNTSGQQQDGGNAYTYHYICDGRGGSTSAYLARISRRSLNLFQSIAIQYWTGPASPAPSDFVNDSNWSNSSSSATGIATPLTADLSAAWLSVTFVPRLNSYVFMTSGNSPDTLYVCSGPTPAGPWTTIYSTALASPNSSSAGPYPLQTDIAPNTAATNIGFRMLMSDTTVGAYTAALVSGNTLTTSAYPISGNCGIGGATISYTGTASGSVTADGLGYYTIPNLANGSYTITPSLAGYTFSPTSSSQTVSNADITGVNFTATPSSPSASTTSQPVPITAASANGSALSITSPTTTSRLAQPISVVFCDANGNERSVTGATVGSEIAAPVPVVLCDGAGHPINSAVTITSNGHSIVVTTSLTGTRMGNPTPVCLTDPNGNDLSQSYSYGALTQSPYPAVLCDVNGNPITITLS